MTYQVTMTGRRLSDGKKFELKFKVEAASEASALDAAVQSYDWEDAATRNVLVELVTKENFVSL